MELEGLLRAAYELLGKGELEQAVKLLDIYVFQKHTSSNEIIGDIIQLRRQFSTIQSAKLAQTLMYDQIRVLEGQLTDSIIIFLGKLRDYETNTAVRAERSGQGMLMHNIPQRMPMGLPTRCTIRIGAIKEALMKDMEKEEFAKVEEIKVSKLMEVQLLSEQQDAFDIKTVNRSEQEIDFDNFAQWRYDVTPLRQGQFSLTLKISTVKYIDGKDRYAEDVYDITVLVETRASHFDHPQAPPTTWTGIAAVGSESNDKGATLLDLLKENKKEAVPVIPPYFDQKGGSHEDYEPSYPSYPKNIPSQPSPPTTPPPPSPPTPPPYPVDTGAPSKSGNNKLVAVIASLIAIAGLAAALIYFFSQSNSEEKKDATVAIKFSVDEQLQKPLVRVNGSVVGAEYDAKGSTITVSNLSIGETYKIEATGRDIVCATTVTVNRELLYQTNPMDCKGGKTSTNQQDGFELVIASPYPFEALYVDKKPVSDAAGKTQVTMTVEKGQHVVVAEYSDGITTCQTAVVDVQSESLVKLECDQKQENSATYTVQLRVELSIYKSSEKLIQPMMDGTLYPVQPEYVDGYMVYTILNVTNVSHSFTLARVSKAYTCDEIVQDVQSDVTLTFNCSREK